MLKIQAIIALSRAIFADHPDEGDAADARITVIAMGVSAVASGLPIATSKQLFDYLMTSDPANGMRILDRLEDRAPVYVHAWSEQYRGWSRERRSRIASLIGSALLRFASGPNRTLGDVAELHPRLRRKPMVQ